MKIELKNNKLVEILTNRGELFKQINKINEKTKALEKDRIKLGYKMNKLKEKTKAIMDKQDFGLKEFEIVTRVYAEKGKAYYEVENMVEMYKEQIREDIKEKAKKDKK